MTTTFCKATRLCCRRENSIRPGHLLKYQTFTHSACENVHFVWTKMLLKSPPALNTQFTWMSNLLHLLLATNKKDQTVIFFCFSEKVTVFQSFADAILMQDLLSTVRSSLHSKCLATGTQTECTGETLLWLLP